jgi:hypothetical protein
MQSCEFCMFWYNYALDKALMIANARGLDRFLFNIISVHIQCISFVKMRVHWMLVEFGRFNSIFQGRATV